MNPEKIVEARDRAIQIVRDEIPAEALPYTLTVLAEIARTYDKSQPPPRPPKGRHVQ